LNRKQLIERVVFIKDWCLKIEKDFELKIGFNGFNRNSYQKSNMKIELLNSDRFKNYDEFKNLLKEIGR